MDGSEAGFSGLGKDNPMSAIPASLTMREMVKPIYEAAKTDMKAEKRVIK